MLTAYPVLNSSTAYQTPPYGDIGHGSHPAHSICMGSCDGESVLPAFAHGLRIIPLRRGSRTLSRSEMRTEAVLGLVLTRAHTQS